MHLGPFLISLKCTTVVKLKSWLGLFPSMAAACLSGRSTPLTKFSSRMKRGRLQRMHTHRMLYAYPQLTHSIPCNAVHFSMSLRMRRTVYQSMKRMQQMQQMHAHRIVDACMGKPIHSVLCISVCIWVWEVQCIKVWSGGGCSRCIPI